jgi:hypothetical protein
MRPIVAIVVAVLSVQFAVAQEEEVQRFGLRYNKDLYSQETTKQTLAAMLRAFERDRYDYLVAHLLDPGFVDEQLKLIQPIYEQRAREQVRKEGLEKMGFDPSFIRNRIRDHARQASYEHIVRRVRAKLDDDPEALKDLKRMAREGAIEEGAAAAVVRLKDVKDRALYLRKVGDRWFIENKMLE